MALTLSRKVGETIWIGDKISIQVSSASNGVARIAITAPDDVPIVREELLDKSPLARSAAIAKFKKDMDRG